jgi:hypothetical protein
MQKELRCITHFWFSTPLLRQQPGISGKFGAFSTSLACCIPFGRVKVLILFVGRLLPRSFTETMETSYMVYWVRFEITYFVEFLSAGTWRVQRKREKG